MQCTVCYEPYDIHNHRPKIVPCGHTFCLQCLRRFQTSECPSCRTAFTWPPDGLTDNFLALEETADMKFVQRSLWCETCSAAPRADCVEAHDVCSWRTAQARLGDDLERALRAERASLRRQRNAVADMGAVFSNVVADFEAATAAAEAATSEAAAAARHGAAAGRAGNGVANAMQAAIRESESRAAAVEDALSVLAATKAEVRVSCNGESRTFSLDRSSGDGAGSEAPELMLFAAFVMSLRLPPGVARCVKFEMSVSVTAPRAGPLPDVTIEFDEMPSRMGEEWSKGWRRYQICRGCLESCHTQSFTPQPLDEGGAAVERGTVCVGRASGRYYIILCHDMGGKFCLPLAASFKVVGRVTRNLSSLDEAVRAAAMTAEHVGINLTGPIGPTRHFTRHFTRSVSEEY